MEGKTNDVKMDIAVLGLLNVILAPGQWSWLSFIKSILPHPINIFVALFSLGTQSTLSGAGADDEA